MFSHAVSAGKYPIKLNTEIVYWLLSVDKISMQNKNVVHIVILCCGFSFTTSIICYTISTSDFFRIRLHQPLSVEHSLSWSQSIKAVSAISNSFGSVTFRYLDIYTVTHFTPSLSPNSVWFSIIWLWLGLGSTDQKSSEIISTFLKVDIIVSSIVQLSTIWNMDY